jgi:hypothetical protein
LEVVCAVAVVVLLASEVLRAEAVVVLLASELLRAEAVVVVLACVLVACVRSWALPEIGKPKAPVGFWSGFRITRGAWPSRSVERRILAPVGTPAP